MNNLPEEQCAVQLIGRDKLVLNQSKAVLKPGPYQLLCKVEAAGLCFSDLKLLKQFSSHVRKGRIISGIEPDVLKTIPSYVPDDAPAVPGHETVVRIATVGSEARGFHPGERFLVQTDYRWLPTKGSNASFGYDFEGGLQEYVLMDLRVITSPRGETMLIPVSDKLSASSIALVEPWACVEDAYACKERKRIKSDGKTLIVTDVKVDENMLADFFERFGGARRIIWVGNSSAPSNIGISVRTKQNLSEVSETDFDDVIYFGSDIKTVEFLFEKTGAGGLFNIVLCGGQFGRQVRIPVGQVHYGSIRIIGNDGMNPAESMSTIPETGQIRRGDIINVIGAAGPMGTMHVIRNICQGIEGVRIFASDLDDDRLRILTRKASPVAEQQNVSLTVYNAAKEGSLDHFNYTVLMAPRAEFVAESVTSSAKDGIINIFAGIPANVYAEIDLDAYIKKRLYFIGTSGSVLEDMKTVLSQVESGKLDTNLSVAAVCGLDGVASGIRAVENRTVAGKIIAYPACKGLGLLSLENLKQKLPKVAEKLNNGIWCRQAEQELLRTYNKRQRGE